MQSKFTIMRKGREKLLREAEFARTREHRRWMKECEQRLNEQIIELRRQQPRLVWWSPKTWWKYLW